jgi:predicted  nucleic acid-binding Zn-ribbon protein
MIKLFILSMFVLSLVIPSIQDTYSVPLYKLTIQTIPNNLLHISGAGTFEPNAVVTTGTAPEEFEGYRFVEWQVDSVPYEGNPVNILMDKGHTAIAYYSDKIAEITVDSVPQVSKITVDGKVYLPSDLPEEFEWDIGTVHSIETEKIVTDGSTRYIFTGWNDLVKDASREQTVIEDFELKALYDTEHFIAASSLYGKPIGGGWYKEGEEVTIPISENYIEENSGLRHSFLGWTDGTKNFTGNSFVVTKPVSLQALWTDEHLLRVESSIPELDIGSSGWYKKDTYAYLFAPEKFESEIDRTLYEFKGWSVSANAEVLGDIETPSISIRMDSSHSVWANWDKKYAFDVDDPYSFVDVESFYEDGDYAALVVRTDEKILKEKGTRVLFEGFDGDESFEQDTKILMNEPKSVKVLATKQYYLDIESQYGGVSGSGWHDEGSYAQFRVLDLHSPAGLWQQYLFNGWSGDFGGNTPSGSILMDGPKKISVKWANDISIGFFNALIIAVALGGGGFFYFKIRKRITGFTQSLAKKKGDSSDDQPVSESKDKTDPDIPTPEISKRKLEELQLETQIENLRTQKEIARASVSALKAEEEQIQARVAGLRTEGESAKSNISSLKLEEEKLQARISGLKSEQESSKIEYENYREKRQELEESLSTLKNDLDSKKEELESLILEQSEKKNEIEKIQVDLDTTKDKSSDSKEEAPQNVIDAASEIISQMNRKCQDLENELKITKNILEKKKTDYENVSSELDESKTEFDEIESEKTEVEKSN